MNLTDLANNICCSTTSQATCCDASDKASCCGTGVRSDGASCGCEAGAAARPADAPVQRTATASSELPVVVIGAGPVGLAAAAHLSQRGERFVILEAGTAAGASILKWGHVRLFSPWRYCIDPVAEALLAPTGWRMPDPDADPLGAELVRDYLQPLAALPQIAPHLHVNARVTSVARAGFDKLKTNGRERAPFMVRVEQSDGVETQLLAKAVIDASGAYESPNPLGASGVAALGERQAASQIVYGIPDVLGADRAQYAGRRVLVVGSGHSAFNAILDLETLARQAPDTRVTWAIRRTETGQMFGGQSDDQLGARGALGTRAEQVLRSGAVTLVTGARVERVAQHDGALTVHADDGRELGVFDRVIATTGFRPDLAMLGELRLAIDDRNEAPAALAPLIDPNVHSCGTVPPHGVDELTHAAEPGFYVIGMKSYGRAPTFLMLTGYEQARSVAAAIAGDWVAAREVRLVLPESGVCGGGAESTCCAPAAARVSLENIL